MGIVARRITHDVAVLFVLLSMAFAGAAYAAATRWVPLPYSATEDGVFVGGLSIPTTTTHVASVYGGGIFRSTDSGTTWAEANSGLPSRNVNFVMRTVEATPVVFAAFDGAGLYRSTDNGATWTTSNGTGGTALTCGYISGGGISENAPNTIYLGTACSLATDGGVWKSTDKGLNWTFMSGGTSGMPGGLTVNDLAVDPNNSSIVYAATAGSGTETGVYKSADGGATWATANIGITTPWGTLTVSQINAHPTNSSELIVQTLDGGVFRTTDAGANWTNVSAGLPAGDFIAGMFFDRLDPTILWAGRGNQGLYRGVISGVNVTWSLKSSAVPGVRQVSRAQLDPTRLYARSYNGLWVSTNDGTDWTQLLPRSNPASVRTAPSVNARVVTTTDSYFTTNDSLYRESDSTRRPISGVTLRSGLPDQIAIDAGSESTVYVASLSNGIFKSTNGATSFSAINTGLPGDLRRADALVVADPIVAGRLYAGFFGGFGYGFYKSTDGGANWAASNTGLSIVNARRIRQILIDPTNNSLIYILTADGMYKSVDAGANWIKPTSQFGGSNRHLSFKSGDTGTLYLARSNFLANGTADAGSGIWRSTNGGVNWAQLLASVPAYRVAVPPASGDANVIYAGISFTNNQSGGVFRSIDSGATWRNYNRGNTSEVIRYLNTYEFDPGVYDLDISAQGNGELALGTARSGADFRNDDFHDVMWRDSIGINATWDYTSAAPGGFTPSFPAGVDPSWEIKGVGDVTGDTKSDVVWFQASTGLVAIWKMNSASSIAGVAFPAAVGPGSPWQIIAVGDISGAGSASILWRNSSTGQVLEWYLDAVGNLAGSRYYGVLGFDWQFRGLGDVDGDGVRDAVWIRPSDGQVAVWRMGGGAVLQTLFPMAVGPGSGWDIAKIGDFDGDGKDDLFWRNADGSTVAIYMNLSGVVGFRFMFGVPFAQWRVDAVGDFDGSGTEDLLWYEPATGNVVRWAMPASRFADPTAQALGGIGSGWKAFP